MKAISVIILCMIGATVSVAVNSDHNGQPGCRTADEMAVRYFAHNLDPLSYWECVQSTMPGVQRKCDTSQMYDATKRECVPSWQWRWTIPQELVSSPSNNLTPMAVDVTPLIAARNLTGQIVCAWPICDGSEVGMLWPSVFPNEFFKCNQLFCAELCFCPRGMHFDFRRQMCRVAGQAENVCRNTRVFGQPQ